MKDKHIRQRYIGGGLVSLSVISLALFGLQLWTLTLGSSSCMIQDAAMDWRLVGSGFYWWTTIVQALLLISLVLVALGSLVSLRMTSGQNRAGHSLPSQDTSTLLVPALHPENVGTISSQNVSNDDSFQERISAKLSI